MKNYNLFKYKTFNEYTLDALSKDKIWYSDPKFFNDIFDTQIFLDQIRKKYSSSELKRLLNDKKIDSDVYSNALHALERNHGILSLSRNCLSNTMWAHYTDYHKGFCMEFEFEKDYSEKIIEVLNSTTPQLTQAIQVEYKTKYDILELDNKLLYKIFYQKSEEWKYEDEYRIVDPLNSYETVNGLAASIKVLKHKDDKYTIASITEKVSEKMNEILTLYQDNYYEDIRDDIKLILEGIETDKLSIVESCLLKQMKIELDSTGKLVDYPSKLVSIIFGYRMSLEQKIKIRECLSHLPYKVEFKRIIQNGVNYKLDLEKETF